MAAIKTIISNGNSLICDADGVVAATGYVEITPSKIFSFVNDDGSIVLVKPNPDFVCDIINGRLVGSIKLPPTSGASNSPLDAHYIVGYDFGKKSWSEKWFVHASDPNTMDFGSVPRVPPVGNPPHKIGGSNDTSAADILYTPVGNPPVSVAAALTYLYNGAGGGSPGGGSSQTQAASGVTTVGVDPVLAGENLSSLRSVYVDHFNNVYYSRPVSDVFNTVVAIGITKMAAASGDPVAIQTTGIMTDPSFNWIPKGPIFVGENGVLTQTYPISGLAMQIAEALSATSLFISIKPPIMLA